MTNSTIPAIDYYDARRAVKLLHEADTVVKLNSPPGQGKTSMMKDIAEDEGPDFGLFEINCALANQPDYMGWFYRCTETWSNIDGQPISVEAGRYTFPYWAFDKRTGRPMFQFKRALVVFEEYGQCELDLKKALGQTMLEKRIGQWKMPEGFRMCCLSNMQGGRDAVGRDYDFLINRRAELNYLLSEDNFLVYGHDTGMLPITMAFSAVPHHNVFGGEVPKEQGPFLTPRSLEAVDKLMKVLISNKVPLADPLVRTMVASEIGMGAGHQYMALATLGNELPKIDDIIKNPMGTKVPTKVDQQMYVVFLMADRADRKNIDALTQYLGRLPSDMSVAFYRNALLRDKSLMSCRQFGDWAVANKTLLAVVNSRL